MNNAADTSVPQLSFNGFKMAVGATDLTINLTLDGREVAVLHAPSSVVKTLGERLEESMVNRPDGYFADAYINPDPERLALEEAMGRIEQTIER
jgi:hypothetical protein